MNKQNTTLIKVYFLLLCFSSLVWALNPYENIQMFKLNNGMQVVLNPNKNSQDVKLKVRVNVGTFNETLDNFGASHLLEHIAFLDENLTKGITYMDLLLENGAKANASTGLLVTEYFASIEAKKLDFILETYSKVLMGRDLRKLDIDNERQSIAIEIGDIDFLTRLTGIDFEKFFTIDYFPEPELEERDFNFSFRLFSENHERQNTKDLSLKMLQKHYNDYYFSENMVLFLTGKFDDETIKTKLEHYFGSTKQIKGIVVPKPSTTLKEGAFTFVSKASISTNPLIFLGTKYHNMSAQETLSTDIYLEEFSNRMMKKLRNEDGATYSVNVFQRNIYKAGVIGITFDTTKEGFIQYYDFSHAKIYNETYEQNLTQEAFVQAKAYYEKQVFNQPKTSADDLLSVAESHYTFLQNHPLQSSQYDLFQTLDYQTYMKNLKTIFTPAHELTVLESPAILFKSDFVALVILMAFLTFKILKKYFMPRLSCVDVNYESVVYTKRTRFLIAPLLFLSAIIIFVLLNRPVNFYTYDSVFLNTPGSLINYYLLLSLKSIVFIYLFFLVMGSFTVKIAGTTKALYFVGLRHVKLSKDDILSVEKVLPKYSYLFGKNRCNYGFLWGWEKEVLKIETKDTTIYIWLKECSLLESYLERAKLEA